MKTLHKYIIGYAVYSAVTLAVLNFGKCNKIVIRYYETPKSNAVKKEHIPSYISDEMERTASELDKKIRIYTDRILREMED